jgi:hypothetical protein
MLALVDNAWNIDSSFNLIDRLHASLLDSVGWNTESGSTFNHL